MNDSVAGRLGGYDVVVFDRILSQALCSSSLVTQTIVSVGDPDLTTPEFTLLPNNWLMKQAALADKTPNICFASDEEFMEHNYLRAPDEEAVRGPFGAPVRELLRENDTLSIQGTGSAFLFYHYGKVLPEQAICDLLDRSLEIARAFHATVPSEG